MIAAMRGGIPRHVDRERVLVDHAEAGDGFMMALLERARTHVRDGSPTRLRRFFSPFCGRLGAVFFAAFLMDFFAAGSSPPCRPPS